MNKSKILRGFIIRGTLKSESPLIIADGSKTSDLTDVIVLRNKKNKPYIPGTSLAGVLRHNYKYYSGTDDVLTKVTKSLLFGDINGNDSEGYQSALRIFDVTLEKTNNIYRDGVSIEYGLGVAKDGHKYDIEAIDKGATGDIYIESVIRKGHIDILKEYLAKLTPNETYTDDALLTILIESVKRLVDMLYNGVQVGGFTTKGFGRIKVENCKLDEFTFANPQSLIKWITRNTSNVSGDETYKGKYKEVKKNTFKAILMANIDSTLLVRGISNDPSIDATMLKSQDDYVLPGSSIKGVFRHHCQYILEKLNKWDTWSQLDSMGTNLFDRLFGGMIYEKEEDKLKVVGYIKSRLSVEEAYIQSKQVKNKVQTRNRIDRFTGGVIDSALFTDESIYQHDKTDGIIKLQFEITDCSEAEAGLMLILIRDLWVGKLTFGSNASIGRGRLCGQSASIWIDDNYYYMENQKDGQEYKHGILTCGDVTMLNKSISKVI